MRLPAITTNPARAAPTASPWMLLRRGRCGWKHGEVDIPADGGAVVVGLSGREGVGAGTAAREDADGEPSRRTIFEAAARPRNGGAVNRCLPAGGRRGRDDRDAGRCSRSNLCRGVGRALVRCRKREFGLDPRFDERRSHGDMRGRRCRNHEGDRRDRESALHGRPRCRAITIRCTSFVPSPISRIF